MNNFNETIIDFFEKTTVKSFEDLTAAVENLRKFERRIWIAGSVGTVERAVNGFMIYHFSKKALEAHEALKVWIQNPTEENAHLAEQKYFPFRQEFHCDDIRNSSNRATSFAVAAIGESDEKSFELSKDGMLAMSHPFVLGDEQTWRGIKEMIISLVK